MTFWEILCAFGVPSAILSGVIAYMQSIRKRILKDNEERKREADALKNGIQALLRAELIKSWEKWSERGYAPIYARENFENCWVQYHALGANGVMDNIHDKFLLLPTTPPTPSSAAE